MTGSGRLRVFRVSFTALLLCGAAFLRARAAGADPRAASVVFRHGIGVLDATGHCFYSVPRTWRIDRPADRNVLAWSPDGRITVEQSWSPFEWDQYLSSLRHMFEPAIIYEETADRFWFQYAADWPHVHQYVAVRVPGASGVCATRIDVRVEPDHALTSTIRLIAQSAVGLP